MYVNIYVSIVRAAVGVFLRFPVAETQVHPSSGVGETYARSREMDVFPIIFGFVVVQSTFWALFVLRKVRSGYVDLPSVNLISPRSSQQGFALAHQAETAYA